MSKTIDAFLKDFDEAKVKVTFGLTDKDMEVINKHINRWDGAEYDYNVWNDIGKEIGWSPLSAALWYFRDKEK